MKLFTSSLIALGALSVAHAGPEVPKKVLKKIAYHQLMSSCWGEDNMMAWYKGIKQVQQECFDLKPTFDINIFDEHDGLDHDHNDAIPDDHVHVGNQVHYHANKPTYQTFNVPQQNALPVFTQTRFGSNVAAPAGAPVVPNSQYDAWLAFWAYQQQQQAQLSKYAVPQYKAAEGSGFRRYKRAAAGIETLNEESIKEFINEFDMFKSDMVHNMANLTCVLTKMNLLNNQLQVNLDFFTREMWTQIKGDFEPSFKAKAIEGYETCYEVAEAIPQEVLDKKPITRQFGRQIIFFKCMGKMEKSLCAKKELSHWLEAWHGPVSTATRVSLGLPEDKYDAAMLSFKIMDHAKTGTEKFIGDFFFGQEK